MNSPTKGSSIGAPDSDRTPAATTSSHSSSSSRVQQQESPAAHTSHHTSATQAAVSSEGPSNVEASPDTQETHEGITITALDATQHGGASPTHPTEQVPSTTSRSHAAQVSSTHHPTSPVATQAEPAATSDTGLVVGSITFGVFQTRGMGEAGGAVPIGRAIAGRLLALRD